MSLVVSPRHYKDGNGVLRHMRGHHADRAVPAERKLTLSVSATATFAAAMYLAEIKQVRVRDQGSEGCCEGETEAEVFDLQLAMRGLLTPDTETSEQDAYKVGRIAVGTPLTDDSGSTGADMILGATNMGVCRSVLCPFSDSPASYSAERTPEQEADAMLHRVELDLICPTEESIKTSLMQGFAVMTGFTCFESLMSPQTAKTGLITYPEAGEKQIGGHAMPIIGWNDTIQIGPYVGAWLLRQHWGLGWGATIDGIQAYGFLPYEYDRKGLMSDNHSPRLIGAA